MFERLVWKRCTLGFKVCKSARMTTQTNVSTKSIWASKKQNLTPIFLFGEVVKKMLTRNVIVKKLRKR